MAGQNIKRHLAFLETRGLREQMKIWFQHYLLSRRTKALLLLALLFVWLPSDRALAIRLKDIATIQGVRHNQLLGYGLVVGLNCEFSAASIASAIQPHH